MPTPFRFRINGGLLGARGAPSARQARESPAGGVSGQGGNQRAHAPAERSRKLFAAFERSGRKRPDTISWSSGAARACSSSAFRCIARSAATIRPSAAGGAPRRDHSP